MRIPIFSQRKLRVHKMADSEGHFGLSHSLVARNIARSRAPCMRSKSKMAEFERRAQQEVKACFMADYTFYIYYFYSVDIPYFCRHLKAYLTAPDNQ